MLQHMTLSLHTTLPFVLLAVLGFFLKRRGLIDDSFVTMGNKIVFYFAIPVTIFEHIHRADLSAVFVPEFLLFNSLWLIFFFLATWGLAYKFMRDRGAVTAFVNSAYRSSLSTVAPPLLGLMFYSAQDASIIPKGILAVSVLLIVSYSTASVMFAVHDPRAASVSRVLLSIAKNPVVIGVVVGLSFNALGWRLVGAYGEATFMSNTVNALGGLTMPLAMICVGGSLTFGGFDKKSKYVIVATVVKLFIMPIVAIFTAWLFGFRGSDLTIIMLLNALPMAVGAYVMQAELGGDSYIGASALVLTMVLSAFTLTLFIFLFRVAGVI